MENKINLSGLSAVALQALAERASALAEDLRKQQPSYELALEAGVEDRSYRTVQYGLVNSYRGEAIVTMADGSRWRCVGHGPLGDASHISRYGFIEFVPLD